MKLLAIDGNSMLNRAFFGVRLLSNQEGIYTNAIFGFLNILLRLEREQKPDATAIAFDVSRHTFRNDQYAGYKANRKGMPEELAMQLPLVQEILTDMGYTLAKKEGYEGDDVLGTLASRCQEGGDTCVIATGDRDCLQLASGQVSICLVKTKEDVLYTPEKIREDYGFDPVHIVDMKALMGDASDNIPGVKGIGEKTALSLIRKYQDIEAIYEKLDELEVTPRVKKLLQEGREMAFLSKQLATIDRQAPLEWEPSDFMRKPVKEEELSALLTRLELFSFFDKLKVAPAQGNPAEAARPDQGRIPCALVREGAAEGALAALPKAESAAILLKEGLQLLIGDTLYLIPPEEQRRVLTAVFQQGLPVSTFMAKPLFKLARDYGETLRLAFDAELAAYLLSPSSKGYELAGLRLKYLPSVHSEAGEEYEDIALLPSLCRELEGRLEASGMKRLFEEIELPLCGVLADMEREGFAVDREGVAAFGRHLEEDIRLTTEEIYRLAGEPFNINSTRELGHILFERLGLPARKKTKTGYSTNVEVLEGLMELHPIVPQVMEYRKLTKLASTYVEGLLKVLAPDGRVHSTFNQTETRTGRISSTEPNVQNIPVRTELGSEMRRFFVAKEGCLLVDADYSQIELRILAHIANDQNMIDAFRQKQDIHAITASQVFGYPLESLPHELRSRAKAINFGIVYGIGAFSLSKNIHVSVAEAKAYIDAYLRTYSGVARYQKEVVEQAEKDGFVSTIYGRRRDLADIHATNKTVKAFAERVALNTPVQGTAADIIKLAMIRVHERIQREKLQSRLILQVHDELIIEAPVDEVEQVKALLKEEMEGAAQLRVPLVADVSVGKTWYEAKE